MQELEKILEEIEHLEKIQFSSYTKPLITIEDVEKIIRKHMENDGWIPVEERMPDNRRSNYEVTFINECGYEEHGFSQWYDGEFHIPAVVIAWREHLKPYRPERSEEE